MNDKHKIYTYDSIKDFVKHCDTNRDRTGRGTSSDTTRPDWAGSKNWGEAYDLAVNGWQAKRPTVNAILDPLREMLADKLSIVTERQHDMVGYEPDIDRFLAGELECMFEDVFVEAPKQGKVYRVLVSGSVSGFVSGETLLKRGIAILALIEAFQMVGSDLEVWTEFSSEGRDGHIATVLVKLHAAGSMLDINSVMFPLAHPSWLRRFFFAALEALPNRADFSAYEGGGYGRPRDLLGVDVIDPTFTLTKGGESTQTRQMDKDPLGFVLDTLKAQGAFRDDEFGN